MTFDDLIDWVEQSLPRLKDGTPRRRRRHVEKVYRLLDRAGNEEPFAKDWLALAEKVAKLLGEDPPEVEGPLKFVRRRPRSSSAKIDIQKSGRRVPLTRAKKRRLAKSPPREPFRSNAELDAAFGAVAAGKPIVFVTGGAGTGKSTFIRELRGRFREKQSIVLAPTGVAALNAGGQTIHSFCRLPLRTVTPEDVVELDEGREVIQQLDLLIIDEISMVRADVLDGVERFLRVNRKSAAAFGGVQVVIVGDLFQLPPVVTKTDEPSLSSRYESPYFFSALCLKGLSFTPVELRIVYRQRDARFAAILRQIRDGEDAEDAIAEINRSCVGRTLSGQYLTLVPTRRAAAMQNERRLAEVPGKERSYEAVVEGIFATSSDDRVPAPRTLVLKRGAQVMFVRNDYPEKRWVNGTLGVVQWLGPESIRVRLEDGGVHEVEPIRWENVRYAWDDERKRIVDEVLGTYTQFPLMPAWAVTIHKAQGLTLSRVAIDLGSGAFAAGQVYVALSRTQSIEGLSLARPVRRHEVRCSEAARAFYAKMRGRRASVQDDDT